MERTKLYEFTTEIDANYTAHKGYIPIPSNVRNITAICPVLRNAEGYLSLFKEMNNEQILNEIRIEDNTQHINSRLVDISISPEHSNFKFVLRLSKIFRTKRVTGALKTYNEETTGAINVDLYRYQTDDHSVISFTEWKGKEFISAHTGQLYKIIDPGNDPTYTYDTKCTLKIIIEYKEDDGNAEP